EEQTAVPPDVDPARLETVHRVALERRVRRGGAPRLEQSPRSRRAVELVDALPREPHELPPPPSTPTGHQRRRVGGIADLDVERTPHHGLVRQDVDDQPVEEESEVADGRAQMGTDEAVRTVAADDEAGLDGGSPRVDGRDVER